MKRFPSNRVLKHVGVGGLYVAAVVFLTTMFSLLGAISCAVVSGMIMGGARQKRASCLLVSLVCPTVSFVLAHVSRALQDRQNVQFALVCFGAYWLAYFLTLGLVLLERKNTPAAAEATAARDASGVERSAAPEQVAGQTTSPAASALPSPEPSLEALRGQWSFRFAGMDGQFHTKLMEISGDQLLLSVIDSHGATLCVAKGGVIPGNLGPFKTLRILNRAADSSNAPDEGASALLTWIYRLEDGTLTVATNLEASTRRPWPRMETYFRLPRGP